MPICLASIRSLQFPIYLFLHACQTSNRLLFLGGNKHIFGQRQLTQKDDFHGGGSHSPYDGDCDEDEWVGGVGTAPEREDQAQAAFQQAKTGWKCSTRLLKIFL